MDRCLGLRCSAPGGNGCLRLIPRAHAKLMSLDTSRSAAAARREAINGRLRLISRTPGCNQWVSAIAQAYIKKRAAALREEGKDPEQLVESCVESPIGKRILQRFSEIIRRFRG